MSVSNKVSQAQSLDTKGVDNIYSVNCKPIIPWKPVNIKDNCKHIDPQ